MTQKDNKFFFDLHDFEKEAEEEKEKRLNKAPPAPTFSLEDMDEARANAREQGKNEGLQLAKDSIEQKTELMVQSLAETVKHLEAAEKQRHEDFLNHSVAMTYKALNKLLPAILEQAKEDLIKAALTEFFQENTLKSEMTLYVHSDMIKPIEKHAQALSGSLLLKSDDHLSDTQARIEWESGAFEFKPDKLMEQILQTIKGRLGHDQQILDEETKKPHTIENEPQDDEGES